MSIAPPAELIDEYTRECITIREARRITSFGVIETFADVMLKGASPLAFGLIMAPRCTAKVVRAWLVQLGANNSVRCARQPLGERLLRKLQWQAA